MEETKKRYHLFILWTLQSVQLPDEEEGEGKHQGKHKSQSSMFISSTRINHHHHPHEYEDEVALRSWRSPDTVGISRFYRVGPF